MNDLQLIGKYILEVIAAGGGASIILYGLLRIAGQKWLEDKFNRGLEEYKRKQNEELEKYKYEINSMFNRVTKIHEIEIDVLPKAWTLLQEAYGPIADLIFVSQRYPDLNQMSEEQLKAFIESTELSIHHKKQLLESEDKNNEYQKIIFWYRFEKTKESIRIFLNHIILNRIFMTSDMFLKFGEIDTILKQSINEVEIQQKAGSLAGDLALSKKINVDAPRIMDEIEELIQKRLHYIDVK